MKRTSSILLTACVLGSFSLISVAQDAPKGPEGAGRGGPRPMPPLVAALDANKDGVIDATEIANASAALKTLDKNSDGKLTVEEIRPARPEGGPGAPGEGKRGPRKGKDGEAPK